MRINFEDNEGIGIRGLRDQPIQKRAGSGNNKHNCLRFCAAWLVVLVVIILAAYGTIYFIVGPLIQRVDRLPNDFPQEFMMYNLETAKIQIQSAENREKLLKLIQMMPNWMLKPFWDYLSDYIEKNLLSSLGDNIQLPNGFTIGDFKNLLQNQDLSRSQTVWFSWEKLDKTKEEIASFYKEKLKLEGFQMREDLTDYKIDVGFWKDNIFGVMSFKNSDNKEQSSVDMMVNYLNEASLEYNQ